MKAVLLINPFTSIQYQENFFKKENIKIFVFYTNRKLKRSGYVLSAIQKVDFDDEIYSSNQNIDQDIENIKKATAGYDLVYCFVCSEIDNFEYSEKIASSLLPKLSNNPETSHLRMNKFEMQEALRKNNVNSITQCKIQDLDIDLFEKESGVVLKPSQETCSVTGVEIFCNTKQFIEYKKNHNIPDDYILQQKIDGKEYVIDTFSVNNKHYIIGVTSYINNEESGLTQAISTIETEGYIDILSSYIRKVLDSLNVSNGFCHSEVMIQGGLPYLIETNPRLPGFMSYYSKSYSVSNNRHHLKVFKELILDNNLSVDSNISPSKKHAIAILLNNTVYSYDFINTDKIKKLSSFDQIDIVKDTGKGNTQHSRLNTVAFILLTSESKEILNSDYTKLIELQDNGKIFELN